MREFLNGVKKKKLSENFYIYVNTKMDLDININVVFSHPV